MFTLCALVQIRCSVIKGEIILQQLEKLRGLTILKKGMGRIWNYCIALYGVKIKT